jgi:hypothetical protein
VFNIFRTLYIQSKLVKKILEEAGAAARGADADADRVLAKLKKSAKFVFEGETVRLK